jgi:serine/threonine-protein kinase
MAPGTSAAAAVRSPERAPLVAFGPFAFDPTSRILRRGDVELALPPRVLGVLEVLLERAGEVVPRQALIDRVWKDSFVTDTSLAEAVSVLRQALGDDPQAPSYIQTVHRRGYRFVAPLAQQTSPAAPVQQAADVPGDVRENMVRPSIAWQLLPWSAAVFFAIAAAIAVWQLTTSSAPAPPEGRFVLSLPAGTALDTTAPALAISRDGSLMAWSACDTGGCRLYLRRLSEVEPNVVEGTSGGRMPFFSPDGRWLGFFADGRLKKTDLEGGGTTVLADAPEPAGAAWHEREIIFAPSAFSGLIAVPADGGEPRGVTLPDHAAGEIRHAWPAATGRNLLFFTIERTFGERAPGDLAVLSLAAGAQPPWRTLLGGVSFARPAGPDLLVVSRDEAVQAVLFDPVRTALGGEPRVVIGAPGAAGGHVAVSEIGTVVHAASAAQAGERPVWWTGSGPIPVSRDLPPLRNARLSPDGSRVAGVVATGGRDDIWSAEIDRAATTRLTHSGINGAPVWTPDGRAIYYAARGDGRFEIWSRATDNGDAARRVHADAAHLSPAAIARDGRALAFVRVGANAQADIWTLSLDGGGAAPLVAGPFDEMAPAFSPDATLMAYQSAESGRWEIYVRRIGGEERALVSTDGGARPFWSRDGSGIYFESGDRLMRAALPPRRLLTPGAAETVAALGGRTVVGMAEDGRILLGPRRSAPSTVTVGLEWVRGVRQMLGPAQAVLPR